MNGNKHSKLKPILILIFILTFFLKIDLYKNKIFMYYSYTEVLEIFENLAVTCPNLIKIDYSQERYGFPNTAGLCDGKPCKNLIVFMTDFDTLTVDRPQIYISGLLHGDEVIGGNMLTELAIFFCNNPNGN